MMEKLRKNLPVILLSASTTLLLVLVILLINGNKFSFSNSTDKKDAKESTVVEKKKDEKIENNGVNQETNTNTNNQTTTSENTNNNNNVTSTPVEQPQVVTPASTPEPVNNTKEEVSEENIPGDENSVVSYFENISNLNQNDTTLSEKIKSGFVSVVDFIFYDKPIKGHTFKELTNTAKLKIIGIALKIDNKIDAYFPGYKERLSEKYKSVKEKLAEAYATYTVKLCDAVGENACTQFKEDYESMKKSFGITGDYLKDAFSKATSKLKDWYENWRDE